MFGGPDKDREVEPLYQTVDFADVQARAEAVETAGARERRIQAEARVVTQPDDLCGDEDFIDADERERELAEQDSEREIRADGGRVPFEGHCCPNCGERGMIQEFAESSWWECANGHVFDFSGLDVDEDAEVTKIVTDGGELPEIHLGDHVVDRKKDDGPKMLVVEISPTRAGDYMIENLDETVAANNDCDPEELVYEVMYLDRCDVSLESIDRFAFPRSRLELAQPLHERDGDQDDSGGDDQ